MKSSFLAAVSARKMTLISMVLIVVIIATAVSAFDVMRRAKPKVESREVAEIVYNVDVFEVERLSFTELLKGFGTAQADREVILAAQVAGEIVEVHPRLRVGQLVSPGRMTHSPQGASIPVDPDVLLRIDPRDYDQQVEQAVASIATLQIEIDQLKQQQRNALRQLELAGGDVVTLREDYERVRTLRERGAGSATDLTRSLLELRRYEDTIVQLENQITLFPHQIDAAEQRLAGARADLQRARNDLARTVVVPPFSGTLAEVMVEQGQYIRAGEPLVRLVDPEKVQIPVSIGFENYLLIQKAVLNREFPIAWLAEHETAEPRWMGRVVRLAPIADSASRTIEVFIEVINSEQTQPLLPGTFVFAGIQGPFHQDALLVSRESVVDGGVYLVDRQNVARRSEVNALRRLQSLLIVDCGVESGDRLVLTNLDVVRDGTRVYPQGVVKAADEIQRMRAPVIQLQTGFVSE